ncbi:hypothetical protein AMAG_13226 [Allomyces macrogynus ATCC 38327]|uniref:Uncharacterized protein n=1 Tax=Allomyces macrogynus (strain ATCC 38327) TaxID=578462 RepID=A0A0L0SZU3_ALLM3|nr:hypothetical protein AMAG_13226 [Allomyces macrogynus ATCC 38327]|eukprot:KNE68053.1 hypothetical protein AMAG_13226 [Allomyces macrogynus ATCC 38327]
MSNITTLHSPTGPAPMLQQLPSIVLDHLARVLASSESECKQNHALLHLALAAPVFYAPCIRVAIRSTMAFFADASVPRRDPNQADVVKLTPSSIGKLIYDREIDQWYLVLPLRSSERALVQRAQGDAKVDMSFGASNMDYLNHFDEMNPSFRTVPASRRWSLLPVPFRMIAHFHMNFAQAGGRDGSCYGYDLLAIPRLHTIPSFCQRLVLSGNVPLHTLDLPRSLDRLDFAFDAVLPDPTVVPDAFDHLPRTLRALTMGTSALGKSNELALAALLNHVPTTLRFLDMSFSSGTLLAPIVAALARLIVRAPGLSGLSISGCDQFSEWDPATFASLPRTGMQYLDLVLQRGGSGRPENAAALARLVAGFPTTVESFSWMMQRSWHYGRRADATSLHSIVARFPLATRQLSVSLPSWDAVIGASLPLIPPLWSLSLESEPNIDRSADPVGALAAIAPRIPATLADLALNSWPIGDGTPALAALAQHLPPHIRSLSLMGCHLTCADLEQFVWPSTLRRLDLKGNGLTTGPKRLPHRLKELDLSANGSLSDTETWIAELPSALEVLSLGETCVSDRVGMALCESVEQQRMPKLRQVDVCDTDMSLDVIEALFTVIGVVLDN